MFWAVKLILLEKMKTSALANKLAEIALNSDSKDSFLQADFEGMSVSEKLVEQTGVIEKLDIKSFEKIEAPYVGAYVHINKIAALVGLSSVVDNAATLSKDLCQCKLLPWEQQHCLTKILTQHMLRQKLKPV